MKIPASSKTYFTGSRSFEYKGHSFLIKNSGQMSIAAPRPDGKVISVSWAKESTGTPSVHLRRGTDGFGRSGQYLGTFESTEEMPREYQAIAEAMIEAAIRYRP